MKFGLASGESRTITLSNVIENIDKTAVETCMNALVANGLAFNDALVSALKATLVDRTTTVFFDNE